MPASGNPGDFDRTAYPSTGSVTAVEMVANGSQIDLMFLWDLDRGQLRQYHFRDATPASATKEDMPSGIDISTVDDSALHATLDGNGFPVVLADVVSDFGILFKTRRSLLLRPADTLDLDGDGMSLLEEGAFALDPTRQDAGECFKHSNVTTTEGLTGTITTFRFTHSHPLAGRLGFGNHQQVGEFVYSTALSSGLEEFETSLPLAPNSLTAVTQPLMVMDPVVGAQLMILSVHPSYRAANPKAFGRLQVQCTKRNLLGSL